MRDLHGEELQRIEHVEKTFSSHCIAHGFEPLRTPTLEYDYVFTRSLGGTSDIVSKEMYVIPPSVADEPSQKSSALHALVVRPEGTAGVVRAINNTGLAKQSGQVKVYYNGSMFRKERPQKGRYREFTQFGVEVMGRDAGQYITDVSVIACAFDALSSLGLTDRVSVCCLYFMFVCFLFFFYLFIMCMCMSLSHSLSLISVSFSPCPALTPSLQSNSWSSTRSEPKSAKMHTLMLFPPFSMCIEENFPRTVSRGTFPLILLLHSHSRISHSFSVPLHPASTNTYTHTYPHTHTNSLSLSHTLHHNITITTITTEPSTRLDRGNPLRVLDSKSLTDIEICRSAPQFSDFLCDESVKRFESIQTALNHLNIPFSLNPHLVRGLDYYTETAFEFISTDSESRQNAVLAGGRYDGLSKELGGPNMPGIG